MFQYPHAYVGGNLMTLTLLKIWLDYI